MTESYDPSKVSVADLAALADRSGLSPFEGHEVIATTMAITNAGDGLSEAVAIEPHEYAIGEEVFVTLRTIVKEVRYLPVPKAEGCYVRKHILRTEEGTIIAAEIVSGQVAAQAERIRLAREKAAGVQRLFDAEGNSEKADELLAAHDKAEHRSGLVDGCPACDSERDAMDAERVADGVRTAKKAPAKRAAPPKKQTAGKTDADKVSG